MELSRRENLPAVDDHFICEDSRVEVVKGRLLMAPPADEPHATAHLSLAFVLGAHLAPGYTGAVDMLTRTSRESDFAPDASIFPTARDPATKGRQLEEVAFEIADSQPLQDAGDKARELTRRGVRRVFCISVKHQRVMEWSAETDTWSPLPADSSLDDRCFVRPLPVGALVDVVMRDEAVVRALVARGGPVIQEVREESRKSGKLDALLLILRSRGLVPSREEHTRLEEGNIAALDGWLIRAGTTPTVGALLEG